METTRKAKIAMLAASSLVAAAAALGPVQASDFDAAAYPAVVEAPMAAPDIAHAADHADRTAMTPAKRWTLIAIAAGALAGIVRLVGAKKLLRAAGKGAAATARVSAKAASAAVKVVGRAAASPLRFAALMTGLALFALTGVGLYDIEWIGGLIAGAAMTGLAAYGFMKMRKALAPTPVKARDRVLRQTEINQ